MKNSQEQNLSKSVRSGQIWQLGKHKFLVGDCFNKKLVDKLLENSLINSIVSDIPYGISYVESKVGVSKICKNKIIKNDDISDPKQYAKFNEDWLKLVIPYLSKKNSIYIFNCDKMMFALKQAMDNCKIYFSQLIIWVKNQATLARKDYAPRHELILYGWYGTHSFKKGTDKSVLFYPKPSKSFHHPTIKPINLISHIILNCTDIGGTVYDPFLGSGTTLMSCEKIGRVCYGAEIDIEYATYIIERFYKLFQIKPILIYEDRQ